MKPHPFSLICVVALLFGAANARAELDDKGIDEALARLPNDTLLTESEKQQVLKVLESREKAGLDPKALEAYRFWLGDRKTFEVLLKRFREEAVSPQYAMAALVDSMTLSRSPYIEIVTALADLLWREVGGIDGDDVILPNAAHLTGKVILDVLSHSRKVPPEVALWAKDLAAENGSIEYAPVMREWWKRNELAFREKRYKDVIPGPSIASLRPDREIDNPPVIESPPPLSETAAPDLLRPAPTVPLAESQPPFAAWAAGAVALVIAALFFLRAHSNSRK